MRDWYDNPALEEIFEEQAEILPDGPLGTLTTPKVEMAEGVAPECVNLLREYLNGGIGTMEFATKMESLRLKLVAQTSSVQPQGVL